MKELFKIKGLETKIEIHLKAIRDMMLSSWNSLPWQEHNKNQRP